jgi:CMP/dCMP kinase
LVIAIDGPAGAGKSSVAKALATRLGFTFLDSGAMYRCVALACLRGGIEPDDPGRTADVADRIRISFEGSSVLLDGEDVTGMIRTHEVTDVASIVSVHPGVREALVARQRELIAAGRFVAEGRDIGTVVSPDSPLKVFLTASPEVRAVRRAAQTGADPEQVLAAQQDRDQRDSEREHGALRPADDAVIVDTSAIGMDEVVGLIAAEAAERGLA